MLRNVFRLIPVILVMLGLPFAASAVSFDVEAKAGGGLALGTTTEPGSTGAARGAFTGGLDFDLFLVNLRTFDLGVSVGGQYSSLSYHGVQTNPYGLPPTVLTSDATFNYLIIPVTLVGRFPIGDSLRLTFRAGGFIGYFLGGSSNDNFSPPYPGFGVVNGKVTLDSSTTKLWEYGIHFTGGTDIRLNGNFFLSPSLAFDMGLTNTNNQPGYPYSDTFWSLTAMIGIKYSP